jgi:hypothetical protein
MSYLYTVAHSNIHVILLLVSLCPCLSSKVSFSPLYIGLLLSLNYLIINLFIVFITYFFINFYLFIYLFTLVTCCTYVII